MSSFFSLLEHAFVLFLQLLVLSSPPIKIDLLFIAEVSSWLVLLGFFLDGWDR